MPETLCKCMGQCSNWMLGFGGCTSRCVVRARTGARPNAGVQGTPLAWSSWGCARVGTVDQRVVLNAKGTDDGPFPGSIARELHQAVSKCTSMSSVRAAALRGPRRQAINA